MAEFRIFSNSLSARAPLLLSESALKNAARVWSETSLGLLAQVHWNSVSTASKSRSRPSSRIA